MSTRELHILVLFCLTTKPVDIRGVLLLDLNRVLSVLLLEGIGRQLDPELDLFKSAIPILRRVGMQMQTSGLDRQTFGTMAKVRTKVDGIIVVVDLAVADDELRLLSCSQIYIWAEMRNLASLSVGELDRMVATGM